MDKILHDPKDPWYIPYNGSCRILSINRIGFQSQTLNAEPLCCLCSAEALKLYLEDHGT